MSIELGVGIVNSQEKGEILEIPLKFYTVMAPETVGFFTSSFK